MAAAAKAALAAKPSFSESRDDSSLSSCLLLQPSLLPLISAKTAATSDQQRCYDRRDRCSSVGDRGMSMSMRNTNMIIPIPKPKPEEEPVEINIDLERMLPPVEYCAVAAVAKAAMI